MAEQLRFEVRLDEFADADIVDMLQGESDAGESLARLVRIGWQSDRRLKSAERTSDLVRGHLLRQIESIARGELSPCRAWKGTHAAIDAELARMRDNGAKPYEIARAATMHARVDGLIALAFDDRGNVDPDGLAEAKAILTE